MEKKKPKQQVSCFSVLYMNGEKVVLESIFYCILLTNILQLD